MSETHELLSDEALATLRAGYDAELMLRMATTALTAVDPEARDLLRFVDERLYRTARMAPIDRERCIITLQVAQGHAMPLAMHVYWGLMEGLSVDEVRQIVLLAGTYGGLPTFTAGTFVLKATLALLATHAAEGGDTAHSAAVASALLKRFR